MSAHEQQQLKETYYGEAIRYMENAKECLKKASVVNDGFEEAYKIIDKIKPECN